MKLKDLSIRKKIMLANFMMIIIPVLIVLLIMLAILVGILAGPGSGVTISAMEKAGSGVTNYQLQMMVDSLSEELVENADPFGEGSPFGKIAADMEQMGTQLWIAEESGVLYRTQGADDAAMRGAAQSLGAGGETPVFLRNENGFVYRTNTPLPDGRIVSVFAVNTALPYYEGEYYIYEEIKTWLKQLLVVVGGAAIVVIILTGALLSGKLSRSILRPLKKLGEATVRIRNGNLDSPVGYASQDELGQVCAEFDGMRVRMKQSLEKQERYERQRRELVAGISHDLLTPVTAIKGYVSGLTDGIADTPEKREHYLRTIYDRACDMDKMVENLFLYSKLDMEEEPFHMERVDVRAYLEDYCGEMRLRLNRDGADLSVCPGGESAWARIDRMQLERVLSNLIDNSVKYQRQGIPLAVRVELERGGGEIRIAVSDNGTGIGAGEEEKIFESFYRTDPARSNTEKGSGLGLSIARRIVERMGGRICARAGAQGGLRVMITLPEAGQEMAE